MFFSFSDHPNPFSSDVTPHQIRAQQVVKEEQQALWFLLWEGSWVRMEARVGMVMEGGQRTLNADGVTAKFMVQNTHQLGTLHQLLAGGIAGAFSKTCTAPLARLTILFQVSYIYN